MLIGWKMQIVSPEERAGMLNAHDKVLGSLSLEFFPYNAFYCADVIWPFFVLPYRHGGSGN